MTDCLAALPATLLEIEMGQQRFESEVSAEQEIMEVNEQFERWKQAMFREEEALAWVTEVARANLEYQKGNEI